MTDLLAIAGWAAGWLAAGRAHRLPAGPAGGAAPRFSVVVPARNEADRLPRLLSALAADGTVAGSGRLIVVDDGSSDGTAAIALGAGAEVIRVGLRAGWTGKAWACWQGAQAADGDVIVFLDADTEPAPGFVARLVSVAAGTGGMVSVQPSHRVRRLYERASAVCNTVALMAGTGPSEGARWWKGPVGFGPALAVARHAYLDAGGHALVRAEVAEDMALAHALARRGVPVAAYADAGQGGLRYRMYPEGPMQMIDGWVKNLAAGASLIPPLRAALVAVWVAGGLQAARRLPSTALPYGLYAAQSAMLFRRAGQFGRLTALAYPLPMAGFVGLAVASTVRRAKGQPVMWRGRPVRP